MDKVSVAFGKFFKYFLTHSQRDPSDPRLLVIAKVNSHFFVPQMPSRHPSTQLWIDIVGLQYP